MGQIPLIRPDLPDFEEIEGSLREILENGRVTNFGKYLQAFEQATSNYLNVPTAAVSSGTLGILFVLQSLGIQAGDKVILPSFTFMATAQAVMYCGGVPVFAKVGDDLNLCPTDLQRLLEKHPDIKAIIGVHMYGLPCDTERIAQLVDDYYWRHDRRVALIYDAAHAFGSSRNNTRVGNFGDAEIFSLSVTKALVSVEGGLVASSNEKLIRQVRQMRNYGVESDYNASSLGLNGKMSEFHAIIGLANLKRLPDVLETRKEKASYFRNQIQERTSFQPIELPNNVEHTFKDFVVLLPPNAALDRNRLRAFLQDRRIETRAYFDPPLHRQTQFRKFQDRPLPKTEQLASRVLTLPFYTSMTHQEMEYVVDHLVEAEGKTL